MSTSQTTTTTITDNVIDDASKSSSSSSTSTSQTQTQTDESISSDDTLEKSLSTCMKLLSADSDEERFVGIVLVKNLIKPDDITNMTRVYRSLGLEFLHRLLQTPSLPSVDSVSYHNLAIAILSTFTTMDTTQCSLSDLNTTIIYDVSQHTLLSQIIYNVLKNVSQSEELSEAFIQESLSFIYSLLSFESRLIELSKTASDTPSSSPSSINLTSKLVLQEDNLTHLATIIQRLHKATNNLTNLHVDDNGHDDNAITLLSLFEHSIHTLNVLIIDAQQQSTQSTTFIPIVQTIATIFRERKDQHRLSLLPILVAIFQLDGFPAVYPSNQCPAPVTHAAANIREAIAQLFQAKKLKEAHRDHSIILFSTLFDLFGGQWLLTNSRDTFSSEKLLVLACQYARTEIQMILLSQQATEEIPSDKINLLLSCYSILDNVVAMLVAQFDLGDEASLTADTLLQIRKILIDSNLIMLEYLKDVAEESPSTEPTHVMVITLKNAGLFLAEEAAESMNEVLKNSLHMIMKYFLSFKEDYGFFISYLLPGIANYIDVGAYEKSSQAKDFFNRQNGHLLLAQYLIDYLPTLVVMAIEDSASSPSTSSTAPSENSLINAMRSYGVTGEIVGNTYLPHACSILYFYLSCWDTPIDINNKGTFIALFKAITESVELVTSSIDQSIGDLIEGSPSIPGQPHSRVHVHS
ncbi:hypothetical protein SAMD00019534_036350 [Acytostelium subglobosum LB1]|uniref:hypothetical protein n=1 Tax=Acytostelium subglobosum LB1 TaxID=1410327 RepID=UPI000644D90A|nr:hypothetical protein SAMD00019534_036350 [Acytostelium subglobosum LB1]GAM20460.1 hypothetical protein SAMD00019534_036350 [Acytostelium subglobosum LB1]|eukprot:XP_012759981.1 hypothetical protein SAMD00019534_036350 [Acytostelium subglobosum LB1]